MWLCLSLSVSYPTARLWKKTTIAQPLTSYTRLSSTTTTSWKGVKPYPRECGGVNFKNALKPPLNRRRQKTKNRPCVGHRKNSSLVSRERNAGMMFYWGKSIFDELRSHRLIFNDAGLNMRCTTKICLWDNSLLWYTFLEYINFRSNLKKKKEIC